MGLPDFYYEEDEEEDDADNMADNQHQSLGRFSVLIIHHSLILFSASLLFPILIHQNRPPFVKED